MSDAAKRDPTLKDFAANRPKPPGGWLDIYPRTGNHDRYHFQIATVDWQRFREARLAVKYDGAPNRWLKVETHDGKQIEVRPAACNLPTCFCDVLLRHVPEGAELVERNGVEVVK